MSIGEFIKVMPKYLADDVANAILSEVATANEPKMSQAQRDRLRDRIIIHVTNALKTPIFLSDSELKNIARHTAKEKGWSVDSEIAYAEGFKASQALNPRILRGT